MKRAAILLSLAMIALIAASFVSGCGSSSDGGGGGGGWTGNVTGTVTDQNSEAISGALCTISATGAKTYYSDTTDETGFYEIVGVPEGTWPLAVSADGFLSQTQNITVIGGEITDIPAIAMETYGYGSVTGIVYSEISGGSTISGAEIVIGNVTTNSGTDGSYTISMVEAGNQTMSATATGYFSYSSTVSVIADTTITKDIVMTPSSTSSPITGVTQWISKRIAIPEVNNATDPDVDDDGCTVAFVSNGNIISGWDNPASVPNQIYVWSRTTGTITRITNNNQTSGSTAGANNNSTDPAISGNGQYVVFSSIATDLLPSSQQATKSGDVFIVRLSDNTIARVSRSAADVSAGGDAASLNPEINGDGTVVVFQSRASNLGSITHTAGFSHIYYVVMTSMTPGARRMLDTTTSSAEGTFNGADPGSNSPVVSCNGRYTAYSSTANNITSAGAGYPTGGLLQVFRNDINAVPAYGWNIHVSKHDGNTANQPCYEQVIDEDGSRIAFTSAATNLGDSSAATTHVYMWDLNSTSLVQVSTPLSGKVGNSSMPVIDDSGRYIGFKSDTIGLVSDVTNAVYRFYVKDVDSGLNTYTLVSRGSSGQVPDQECTNPALSGDGNFAVWETASKNIVEETSTTGIVDVFIRKWK
ncbi:MAG: carboxypeptidase regulatory-like domain-containing protein [Firmicutes bacterium]|nr:carboxypeptidase regulatory-like domain-containing protein [Bacillota bacterium]